MPLPQTLSSARPAPHPAGPSVITRKTSPQAGTPGVASHLIAAVAACGPSVIMDLAGLEGIGYSGPPVLLRVRRWTRRSGGDLLLAAPQPVRRIWKPPG
jgi:STAS domain-containing protein